MTALRIMPAAFILMLTACTLNDTSADETYLSIEANPQLLTYSRVTVMLGDTLGNVKDTLYDDSLTSLARLNRLPAAGYQGGTVDIIIKGYRNGVLVYDETRVYDGRSQRVLTLAISKDGGPTTITGPDTLPVTVPRAPLFVAFPGDTTVSIRDSVPLASEVSDPDGDLARYAWDCNGDGIADDSGSLGGYRQKIPYGRRFANPGSYGCTLSIWDKGGRVSRISDSIKVELDMPVADAGKDTEVVVGATVLLHARGWDGYGPIVSRSWKIGSKPFVPVTQQETSIIAPMLPGDLICILMVTDSDSLSASDTLTVKVLAAPVDSLAH